MGFKKSKKDRTVHILFLNITAIIMLIFMSVPGLNSTVYSAESGYQRAENNDKDIAIEIGDEIITTRELLKRYDLFLIVSGDETNQTPQLSLEEFRDYYISKRLLLQEAKRLKIEVKPAEIEHERKAYLSKLNITEEMISTNLTSAGLSIRDVDQYFEEYLIMLNLGRKSLDIKEISDEEARRFYESRNEYFNHPERISASHILICHKQSMACSSSLNPHEARELAENIKNVATPENFARLASRYSTDSTGKEGGGLGFIQRGLAAPAFEEAAFRLKKGEISNVVETDYGYHIILVTDRQEARAVTYEQAEKSIKRDLMTEHVISRLSEYSNELLKEAHIKKYGISGDEKAAPVMETGSEKRKKTDPPDDDFPTFNSTGRDECRNKDGKPIIMMFGSPGCSHCNWIGETFDFMAMEYIEMGLIEAHHYDAVSGDDFLTPERETAIPAEHLEIYERDNPDRFVPYFSFGCRYDRVGTGYEFNNDLYAEEMEMRKIINTLIE